MKFYTADYILPVAGDPVKDGIIATGDDGKIIGLYQKDAINIEPEQVEQFEGILVPGFVNSHCHLELSHLHGKIPGGEGLISFVGNVLKSRSAAPENMEAAMEEADREMWANGIVAVGDISNTAVSRNIKEQSKIYYHTFIELIGFSPQNYEAVFQKGLQLKDEFSPLKSSLTPHATYSVCKDLLRAINSYCLQEGDFISIHNQETEEENKFYRYKTGRFLDFYRDLQINIDFFKPQARNSIQSILPLFSEKVPAMMVHNIYTSLKDIYFVRRSAKNINWCFCPNANLYIEKRLPKIDLFLFKDFNIMLGTDSLASNSGLCILSELKTLHDNFPSLKLTDTIAWATLNGAKFLNIEKHFGSFEAGKTPGINLITAVDGLKLTKQSAVKRII
ncbi:amidohydrolase family protein [Rubrolithibacter danxiaensis]|uniref:amidohydrolase family protein n=1 Tax=Rubrolithibacter danxiaensis TaxID=3390805 RepID=UPI003BF912C3